MASTAPVALYVRTANLTRPSEEHLDQLRAYARARGWATTLEFVDQNACTKKDRAPAWQRCWQAIGRGQVKVLLVPSLTHLGHNLTDLVELLASLAERQVQFVSVQEAFDSEGTDGPTFLRLIQLLQHYQRTLFVQQTLAGMRSAKARGRKVGNQPKPFDTRRAAELRAQGWGVIRIAKALGVGVGRVHRWLQRDGKPASSRADSRLE